MTTTETARTGSGWRRFWRQLAAIEEDILIGYEAWQDRRIARMETELLRLKAQIETLSARRDPLWTGPSDTLPASDASQAGRPSH